MKGEHATKPGYLRVQDDLKSRIISGEWAYGEQIPTERELEKEFRLSRVTISKGLASLVHDGFLERHPGRGTFVVYGNGSSVTRRLVKYLLPISPHDKGCARYCDLVGAHDVFIGSRYDTGVEFYRNTDEHRKLLSQDKDAYYAAFITFYEPSAHDELYRLKQTGFPFVLLDAYPADMDTDYAITDNVMGGSLIVEHLASLGHRRIVYVTRPIDRSSLADRLCGFIKGAVLADLPFSTENVIRLKHPKAEAMPEVVPAVEAIMNSRQPPSAIAFSNDDMAIEATTWLRSRGVSVPGDVSIMGYDDAGRSAFGEVPLTTVAQDFYQMGRVAAEILLQRLEDKAGLWPEHVVLKPQLVVRNSTGAVR